MTDRHANETTAGGRIMITRMVNPATMSQCTVRTKPGQLYREMKMA